MNRFLTGAVVALVMAWPVAGFAHEGHVHKVLGTVVAVEGAHVQVKTQDGKTVKVDVDAKTVFTRGTTKVDVSAMRVGDRVVVDAGDGKAMLARSIKLGATK